MTPVSAQLKLDVTIPAEGGIELGAWLFLPEGDGIRPAITMAHGFGGTREHGLERFAQAFVGHGIGHGGHLPDRAAQRPRANAPARSRRTR